MLCGIAWGQSNTKEESENKGNQYNYQNNSLNQPARQEPPTVTEQEIELKGAKKETVSSRANTFEGSSQQFQQYETQSTYMRTQRTPSVQQQQQMDDAVNQLEKLDPKSFEYHYFKYVSGNYNTGLVDHLKTAEKLRPNNADVQAQMAAYYLITEDSQKALDYLSKVYSSGRLPKEAVSYGRDLLRSVPANGILVTHGFDDTYASAYLQLKEGIRKDVRIVSLDFLQSQTYRKKLEAHGIKLPPNKVVDVAFLEKLCALNQSGKLALSLTVPKEYLEPIMGRLYIVGLVFEYHAEEYNNIYMNDYLWNKELDKVLITSAETAKAKNLSANYLPMLLILRRYYTENSEPERLEEVESALDKVAVQCNKYEQVRKLKASY